MISKRMKALEVPLYLLSHLIHVFLSISFLISDVFIFLYGADLKPFNTFVMQNNDSGVDCVYVRKRDFRFWQEKFK